VEIRIEPQTITDFLKWQNRLAEYNGGTAPEGVTLAEAEANGYLESDELRAVSFEPEASNS
jgi:hypothetical protein